MKAALPVLAATVMLAACVPSTPAPVSAPVPAQVPRPVPAPAAPASVIQAPIYDSWMDAPTTPGTWRYQPVGRGSQAVFVGGSAGEFALACSLDTRSIALTRFGSMQRARAMTIRSEAATRSLPVIPSGEYPALAASTLAPNDTLLDAMALSKGRFAVEVDGAPTLYLPSHAEVSRVIEDCR